MICDNVRAVSGKMQDAAKKSGRGPLDIRLVAVAKGRTLEEIKEVIDCGIRDIGENKVQEAVAKHRLLNTCHSEPEGRRVLKRSFAPLRGAQDDIESRAQDDRVHWHMVGHLQTNKVKDAVRLFDLIHSVDSLRLANEIDKEAAKINKIQDVLIEVKTSGEATKFGVAPEELIDLVKEVISLKNIRLLGLMTMAPIVKDKEEARPYFRKLRRLKDEVNKTIFLDKRDILVPPDGGVGKPRLSKFYSTLSTLSMGMSQDYEVAIEEGATMVRIGTAIFGKLK